MKAKIQKIVEQNNHAESLKNFSGDDNFRLSKKQKRFD